jgi:energy-converting hydrogenase Eha subunit H
VRLGASGVPATVEAVEALGAENVVALDAGGVLLHALVAGEAGVAPGAAVHVEMAPERLIWFGADGQRLDGRGAVAG